jgi:hypothetical protein
MPLWDKVKQELDRAGQVAQDALDEGRIRLEAHRARQAADKAAEELGYAVYRARGSGATLDDAELARHAERLGAHEAEVTRLEAQMREIQQRWRAGGGMGARPSAGGDGGSGPTGGPDVPPAPVPTSGPPDVGPVGTASASAGMETPPEASGGPVPPPESTPPVSGVYGVVPPVTDVSATAPETDKPTTDMWRKGDVFGHEPY